MASPESGGPGGEATFTPSVTLKEGRELVAAERNEERTSLRDKEILKGDPSELTEAEHRYTSAFIHKTEQQVLEMKEHGADWDERKKFIADKIVNEMIKRQQAEIEARENPSSKLGKLKAKFVNAWKKHPKTRLLIGVGLTVASGGVAAAGGFAVAGGLLAARAAMAGVGGYIGAKAGQEVAGARFNRRKESMWSPGSEGNLAAIGETKEEAKTAAENMTSEERVKRMAALLSPEALVGRTKEMQEADERTLKALKKAERDDILAALNEKQKTHWGRNLVDGAMQVLDERVTMQLNAERDRVVYDKQVNRRRTAIAGVVGFIAGATATVTGVIGLEHAHHAQGAGGAARGAAESRGGGGGAVGTGVDGHHAALQGMHEHAQGGVQEHMQGIHSTHPDTLHNPGHYPDYVTNSIQPGEHAHDVARKLGSRIVEVRNLDTHAQKEAFINFVAKHTVKVAGPDGTQHWHTSKAVLQRGLLEARGVK